MFRVLVFTVTQTHTKRPHEIKTYSFTDVFERWEFDEDGGFNDPSKSSNNKKKSKTRGKVQKTAVHAVVKKKKMFRTRVFPVKTYCVSDAEPTRRLLEMQKAVYAGL